jgi:hypothetical protein
VEANWSCSSAIACDGPKKRRRRRSGQEVGVDLADQAAAELDVARPPAVVGSTAPKPCSLAAISSATARAAVLANTPARGTDASAQAALLVVEHMEATADAEVAS